MKIHLDPDKKQVSVEGDIKLCDLFNRLMSWFPEEWEEWTMVQHTPTINYREVLVDKTNWRNPYWNPWGNITYQGETTLLAQVPVNELTISNGTSIVGNGNLAVANVQNSNITLANSTVLTNTTSNNITLNLNNVI